MLEKSKNEKFYDPSYFGNGSRNYESKRKDNKFWKNQNKIVYKHLKQICTASGENNLNILDIPVGTGRFFDLYKEFGLSATGIDMSEDMLAEAKKKAATINFKPNLVEGSITDVNFPDNSFDISLCLRIFHLLDFNQFAKAIEQLTRVSKEYIILGITVQPAIKKFLLKKPSNKYISILFNRMKLRISYLYKKFRGIKRFRYKELKVLSVFDKNRLKISEKDIIQTSKDGSISYLFLLKKQ